MADLAGQQTSSPPLRRLFLLVILLLVVGVGVTHQTGSLPGFNRLQSMTDKALVEDSRNVGVRISVSAFSGNLRFDLAGFEGRKSPADLFRTFLMTAAALKGEHFDKVTLRHCGQDRFFISGDYFHTLGDEYGRQNVVYTIRTFPEKVHRMDGSPAFPTWEGGLIGVAGKQMEDFKGFTEQWLR